MIWTRHGEMGMIAEPYRVGKFHIDGRSRYGLFFNNTRLGWFDSFEDCQTFAEAHAKDGLAQVMEGRT